MTRSKALLGVALILLLAFLIALLMRGGGAEGSTLGRGAGGWLGLFAVLENRGLSLERHDGRLQRLFEPSTEDQPNEDTPPYSSTSTTLVTAFPWQSGGALPDAQALTQHLRSGGRVLIGYSGAELAWTERLFLDDLGISQQDLDRERSLLPWRWWREQGAESLRPVGRLELEDAPETARLHWVPAEPSPGLGEVLLESGDGDPVLTRRNQLGGEVWLLPTSLFANGYLSRPGNSALLLALESSLGNHLIFDEFHHGLVAEQATETTASQSSLDTTLLQLGLVYLVALTAFAWRFGPSWPTRPPTRDSHREFLVGVGGVHERLGHERDAARTLVDRAGAYWPRRLDNRELEQLRADATKRSLLDIASELSLRPANRKDTTI